jgi:flagellar biogenesis protein FliO
MRALILVSVCCALAFGACLAGPARSTKPGPPGRPAAASAQDGAKQKLERVTTLAQVESKPPARQASFPIAWMLLALVLVVGVVYLLGAALRAGGARRGWSPGRAIVVLESRPIGPDRWLHLVEIGDAVLLLGSTSRSVVLLHEVTDAGAAAVVRERAQGGQAGFSGLLAAARRGLSGEDRGGLRAAAHSVCSRLAALASRRRSSG